VITGQRFASYSTRLEQYLGYVDYLLINIRFTSVAHILFIVLKIALGCENSVQVIINPGVNIKATVSTNDECTGYCAC